MSSPLNERSDPSTTLLRPQSQSPRAAQRAEVAADPISDRVAIHYNTTLSLAAANPNDGLKNAFFLNQLLAVCGGANAADAVEILAVSFILPAAQDDLHLSGAEKGWLAGVIFAGHAALPHGRRAAPIGNLGRSCGDWLTLFFSVIFLSQG